MNSSLVFKDGVLGTESISILLLSLLIKSSFEPFCAGLPNSEYDRSKLETDFNLSDASKPPDRDFDGDIGVRSMKKKISY